MSPSQHIISRYPEEIGYLLYELGHKVNPDNIFQFTDSDVSRALRSADKRRLKKYVGDIPIPDEVIDELMNSNAEGSGGQLPEYDIPDGANVTVKPGVEELENSSGIVIGSMFIPWIWIIVGLIVLLMVKR